MGILPGFGKRSLRTSSSEQRPTRPSPCTPRSPCSPTVKRKHISQNRDIIKSNAFLQIRIRDLETRIQHLEAERHGDRALICQLQSELHRLSWQKGVNAKRVWMELGKSMGFLDPRAVPSSSASPSASVGPSTLALPAAENPSWAMPPGFPGGSFHPHTTSQPSRITLDPDALPPGIVRSVARPPALGIDEIAETETEAEEGSGPIIDRAAFDDMDIRDDSPVSTSMFYPPLTTLDTDGAPSPLPSPALEEGMFAQQSTVTQAWHRFLADGSSDFAATSAAAESTSSGKARPKKSETMKGKRVAPSRRQSGLHAAANSADSEPPSADEVDVAPKPAARARRVAVDASKKGGMVSTDEDDEMVDVDTALEPTTERAPSPVQPIAAPVKDVSMSPPTSRKRKPSSPKSAAAHAVRPSTPDTAATEAPHTYSDHMEESEDHAEAAEAAEPVYPARMSRRSSVRARASVNYTLPKLNTKMRKPDPEDLKPAMGTTIVRTSVTPSATSSSRSTPAASAKAESPINGDLNELKRERQQQQQQVAAAASSSRTTTRKSSAAPKAAAGSTTARRSRARRTDPAEEEADGDDEGGGRSSRQVSELETSDDDGDTAPRRRAAVSSSGASSSLKHSISPGRGRGHVHQPSEDADEEELGEEALGLDDDEDDRTIRGSSAGTRRPEPYTALSGESLSELFHTHRPSLEGDQGDRTEFSRPPSAIDTTEDEREGHDSDADMTPGTARGNGDGGLSAAKRGIRARLSRKGSAGSLSSSSSRRSSVVSEALPPAAKPKQPAQPRRPSATSTSANGAATPAATATAAKARSSSASAKTTTTAASSSRMTNSTAASRGRSVSANAVLSGDSSSSATPSSATALGNPARKRLSVTTNAAGGKLTPREYPPNGVGVGDGESTTTASASTKRPLASSSHGQSQASAPSALSSQQLTDADLAALAASSSASLAELTSAATAAWPSTPQVGINGVHRRVPGVGLGGPAGGTTGRKVAALSRFSASSAGAGAGKAGTGAGTGTAASFQRTSVKVPSGRTVTAAGAGKKSAAASQQAQQAAQHSYAGDRGAGNENQEPAATVAVLADGDSDDF